MKRFFIIKKDISITDRLQDEEVKMPELSLVMLNNDNPARTEIQIDYPEDETFRMGIDLNGDGLDEKLIKDNSIEITQSAYKEFADITKEYHEVYSKVAKVLKRNDVSVNKGLIGINANNYRYRKLLEDVYKVDDKVVDFVKANCGTDILGYYNIMGYENVSEAVINISSADKNDFDDFSIRVRQAKNVKLDRIEDGKAYFYMDSSFVLNFKDLAEALKVPITLIEELCHSDKKKESYEAER